VENKTDKKIHRFRYCSTDCCTVCAYWGRKIYAADFFSLYKWRLMIEMALCLFLKTENGAKWSRNVGKKTIFGVPSNRPINQSSKGVSLFTWNEEVSHDQ
jgi:hypothetical protein